MGKVRNIKKRKGNDNHNYPNICVCVEITLFIQQIFRDLEATFTTTSVQHELLHDAYSTLTSKSTVMKS